MDFFARRHGGWLVAGLLCISIVRIGRAQHDSPIEIFGYFQNIFQGELYDDRPDNNTFSAQQLNLFFQKDLAPHYRAFLNFEFLNSFSSSESWGAANLKEAWVRYDLNKRFKLKLGLQTPVFNHLNEIKTRTPLLPYIVRPIVYETSLEDVIRLDEYVPERGYLQMYGTLPIGGKHSFDYSLFAGNSPNIRRDRNLGQTGVDSTTNVLVGGRMGIRLNELVSSISEIKVGLSIANDRVNYFREAANLVSINSDEAERYKQHLTMVPRTRVGVDLSMYVGRFYLESEGIGVFFGFSSGLLQIDRAFAYGTLGYFASDQLEFYVSYWRTDEEAIIEGQNEFLMSKYNELVTLDIPTAGVKLTLNERVMLKAQAAHVEVVHTERLDQMGFVDPTTTRERERFMVLALGVSVFF